MSEQSSHRIIERVGELRAAIREAYQRPLTVMEVCGTHTMSIARWGIRGLLPEGLRLISGPGCPVCVTDSALISRALAVACLPQVIFTSFGDMLKVPSGSSSLQRCRDMGADVRVMLSPLDALELARREPSRQVVFFAVGFETTAPLTAAVIDRAAREEVANFSVICGHKTMPAALRTLLTAEDRVDALLCPGHVAVTTGARAFDFVAQELGRPAAIAGFGPDDILAALLELVRMDRAGEKRLVNCYAQAVDDMGNKTAQGFMDRVFQPCDAVWRGLGLIPGSGLALRPPYAAFDAMARFGEAAADCEPPRDPSGCCCGQVLRGLLEPEACPLFGRACTPEAPVGACMVSAEGSCAAAYKYREVR